MQFKYRSLNIFPDRPDSNMHTLFHHAYKPLFWNKQIRNMLKQYLHALKHTQYYTDTSHGVRHQYTDEKYNRLT